MFAAGKTKGASAVAANYIEDVFSTWLYTGNGSTQTINNGIDLAGKGGLVWGKSRTNAADHFWTDTARGNTKVLFSDLTNAQGTSSVTVTGFNNNGFGLGAGDIVGCNNSGENYASWTFRKQPKFFDVVTYTGDGNASRVVSHALASQPGFIAIKRTSGTQDWIVAASDGAGNYKFLYLNQTSAALSTDAQSLVASSTGINVGWISSNWAGVNVSGQTFVAYLWASNAGGFGLTGTDNVISCGSLTTDGSGNGTVNLGYEPQWILIKPSSGTGNWRIADTMRGFSLTSTLELRPNQSSAEATFGDATFQFYPNATGFTAAGGVLAPSTTYIYIAIRRGPMKTPTSGTSVFLPKATSNDAATITTGFPVDLSMEASRGGNASNFSTYDRLRGANGAGNQLVTSSTAAEVSNAANTQFANNTGFSTGQFSGLSSILYLFGRAPGFFDEVCYTGTGSAATQAHNLGVVPEMMIVKYRTPSGDSIGWVVYHSALGNGKYLRLDATDASTTDSTVWNNTTPTSSVFTIGTSAQTNASTYGYVTYLFASCPGVSKVGTYTGNGSTQTINCGFTGGARFVLIKRTDSTGDWYVYDTARGMTTLTDPYLLMNSTAAESATLGSVTTVSTGFAVNASILAAINTNAASYIYLAIA